MYSILPLGVFQIKLKQVICCRCNLIQVEKTSHPFLSYVLFQWLEIKGRNAKSSVVHRPILLLYVLFERWSTLKSYLINPFELLNALLLLFSWYPVVWKLVVYNLNLRCLVFGVFIFLFEQFWCYKILFCFPSSRLNWNKNLCIIQRDSDTHFLNNT